MNFAIFVVSPNLAQQCLIMKISVIQNAMIKGLAILLKTKGLTVTDENVPNKYIVFNREVFNEWVGQSTEFRFLTTQEIVDAVVIRRQDKFASPCLLTYAVMIAMVADCHLDDEIQKELQKIADYFHEQGVLAGEEGWKLTTL